MKRRAASLVPILPIPHRSRRLLLLIVFASIAGLGAITYVPFERDMARAQERVSRESRIAQTPCGPIEYSTSGSGTPVLVVHGAGGGIDQGLTIGAPLVAAGYRVIVMSRFGYLRTPLPIDASAQAQADAHACLLDALGVERVAVLGASAGAPSSLQLALRHPERVFALALLVPATHLPEAGGAGTKVPPGLAFLLDTALRSDFLFWAGIRTAPGALGGTILGIPPAVMAQASADDVAKVNRMLEDVLPVSSRRQGLINDAKVTTSMPRYELERIRAPTLVISAADDPYGTYPRARYTAEQITGARFVGYPSGGHLLVGRDREVYSEIVALFRQPASGRSE